MTQRFIKTLLIEDNFGDVRLIQEMLTGPTRQKGGPIFEITPVDRLQHALLALDRQLFDLVLVDLSLPDSQGIDTVDRILQAVPQLPVVVMSDLEDQDLAVDSVKIGAQDYLVKSYINEYSLARALHYAIERKRTEEALKRSEAFNRGVLSSLNAHIAVLNRQGDITAVNQAWERFAQDNGGAGLSQFGVGTNYLEVCRRTTGKDAPMAQAALAGIQAVLDGSRPFFTLEYPCHAPDQPRWFVMQVTPFLDEGGGVVVTHENITSRKLAEAEVYRRNRELGLLNQIIAASVANLDPEIILEIACRELALTFQLPHATATLFDEVKTTTTVVAEYMAEERQSNLGLRLPVAQDPAFQYLLQHKAPLVANQAQQDPRLAALQPLLQQYQVSSLLIIPLLIEEEIVGSLSLETFEPHHFSPEEINLAWSVADQAVGALARARLVQTHQRLVTAIEQVTENIVIIDIQGKIVYVNPGFERLTGYSRAEVMGQDARFMESDEHRPEFDRELWGTVSTGQIWRGRLTNRKKDGSLYVEDTTITPVRNHEGVIINYVAVKRDVTRELQLEEQYHQVISSLSDHIYVTEVTADGQHLNRYLSPNVEALTGYSPGKFKADWGFWPYTLIHPEDRAAAAAHARQLAAGESGAIEYRVIRADGQIIWVRDSGKVIQEGNSKIVYGVVGEITARKQREHELKVITEIAADLRTASSRADIPPIVVDQLLNLLQARGCALGIYDPARDEVVIELAQGLLAEMNKVHFSPETDRSWQAVLTGQPYLTTELDQLFPALYLNRLNDHWAAACMPLIADKQPIGALWIVRQTQLSFVEIGLLTAIADITANALYRASLFEALQRSNAELVNEQALLAQRVAERTAELSHANAELARAARLKDEFLASMSHELRTPLNTILGMGEVLREQVYGELNEQQLTSLRYIDESGQHLLALITDILDLSKIEAGKLELDVQLVAVDIVCQSSLQLIKQQAQKKHIKVLTKSDNAITMLQADQRRLKQILVNLLSNAVKFTPEQGQVGLEVTGNKEENRVHFTVWDTGIGISAENMTHLFQPFVQLDSKLSRQYEGTGLGLSLVSRLAEMHGGGIAVESEVGKGSRFTVSLPWNTLENEFQTDQGEAAWLSLPSTVIHHAIPPLILLAEDNVTNILTLQQYLQIRGYQVIVARNGAEAVKRTFEQRPDLVLMDIQMPLMDGLEATRQIRSKAEIASTPIIAVTALAMPGDRERCLEAGVNEYLTKPINFTQLIKVIETQLTNRGSANGT